MRLTSWTLCLWWAIYSTKLGWPFHQKMFDPIGTIIVGKLLLLGPCGTQQRMMRYRWVFTGMLAKFAKGKKWWGSTWTYHCLDPKASGALDIFLWESRKNWCIKGKRWIAFGAKSSGVWTSYSKASIRSVTLIVSLSKVLSWRRQDKRLSLGRHLLSQNYAGIGFGWNNAFLSKVRGREAPNTLFVSNAKHVQRNLTCITMCDMTPVSGKRSTRLWLNFWFVKCRQIPVTWMHIAFVFGPFLPLLDMCASCPITGGPFGHHWPLIVGNQDFDSISSSKVLWLPFGALIPELYVGALCT